VQHIHDFRISVKEYHEKGQDNQFPEFSTCPLCRAQAPLKKHGFYQRYAIVFRHCFRIFIRRYYCTQCKKTISVLPTLLLPYYQHSLEIIMSCLEDYFTRKKSRIPFYRQFVDSHGKRFLRNVPRYISFFRDLDRHIVFNGDRKEKAIKLLEMISSFPKEPFAKRFFNHFNTSFMAL